MLLPNFEQIQPNPTVYHVVLCTNYALTAFDSKKTKFPVCPHIHCSNLLVELQIFTCLLLQLSS